MDLREGLSSFRFDPTNKLPLVGCKIPADFGSACTTQTTSPNLSHLYGPLFHQISAIIAEFSDVLTSKLGLTRLLEYDIQLSDSTPAKLPPYRLMPPKIIVLRDFRPVVDYRALNKKIKVESVPLPDIQSCFHWFGSAKVFTSLDTNSAYHRIGLTERSRPSTAFTTDWNLHEYTSSFRYSYCKYS
jgi:hypothetical protein